MSKITFAELQKVNSEFNLLDERETTAIIGGRDYYKKFRKSYGNINIVNVVQINNNINVQIAFNGDNFNVSNLNNNAGAS